MRLGRGLALFAAAVASAVFPQSASAQGDRQRLSMDAGWHFALGNAADPVKDFGFGTQTFSYGKAGQADGPASVKFDDRAWRVVDLPHDWAVALPFSDRGDSNHGSKAIGRNFPENSVGWYRKTFYLPKQDQGKRIGIDFDGVYRDSQVWLNGFLLGEEHSGYSSFHYDMTDYLNYGGDNTIVVRANATAEEGWFYEGSGIYRHVWMTKTNTLHVAHDGTFVTSTVNGPDADVSAKITPANDGLQAIRCTVKAEIEDAEGHVVATSAEVPGEVKVADTASLSIPLKVPGARLWSLETPYLYKLITLVSIEGKPVDRYETPFGIRTIRFDPDKGFFLNGKHVELKGTNDHQDHAGVGIAVPDRLNAYRIERLKAMGSNAIRMSHNPPSPQMLDLCDRLGMLVLDENRLMGATPETEGQLRRMIERDRNHPSVILWSVGNEEWALEWSVYGERLTRDMQALATRLDPTRLSTVALSGSGAGNSLASQVLGFNYYLQHDIDKMHARFPERPVVGTEESSSEHTRGIYVDDLAHQHLVAYDYEADGKHASIEEAWNYHLKRPFSAGLFYWTGFDYRGEPTPFGWPAIESQFGMIDACGFFKDNAFLLQSFWTDKPMVHLLPHWDWPGKEGQEIPVWVYSNADEVELSLNGTSLGRKPVPRNSHLEWKVKYAPGALIAKAYKNGAEVATDKVETTNAPASVELLADRPGIAADGHAIDVITVRVKDAKGRVVPIASNTVAFQVTGPGKIIGVGNGDPASHEADQYLEKVSSLSITGWKTIEVKGGEGAAETAADFDDSKWERARDPRWDEKRVDPERSVYRGSFYLPAEPAGTTLKLMLRSVGETQSIYVNGHALGKDLKRDRNGFEFALDSASLRPGRNVVAILAARFSEDDKKQQNFKWDGEREGTGGPGVVQVVIPAETWRRSVFNGLAEVIVQSSVSTAPASPGAGKIVVTATSPGLTPGTVEIESQASRR
jgi:beta-galactosidase